MKNGGREEVEVGCGGVKRREDRSQELRTQGGGGRLQSDEGPGVEKTEVSDEVRGRRTWLEVF